MVVKPDFLKNIFIPNIIFYSHQFQPLGVDGY